MPRPIAVTLFAIISVLLAAGCVFFAYYTVRLAYVNLSAGDISRRPQSGMYIGAVAFPVASLTFGYLSFRCARAAMNAARGGRS
jgi:hypothetical protein